MKKVDRWKMEMPTEAEMLPKDKYTVFDRKVKRYRKGIHSEFSTSQFAYHEKKARLDNEEEPLGRLERRVFANKLQRYPSGQESARD